MDIQPAKKKKAPSKQADIGDFFAGPSGAAKKSTAVRKISQSMKPASPKLKKTVPKIVDDDDDDDMDFDALPKPPPRTTAPARAARGATKKYVEILSDEDEGDASMFVDDDD